MGVVSKTVGTLAMLTSFAAKDVKAADTLAWTGENLGKAAKTALEAAPKDSVEIGTKAEKAVEEAGQKSSSSYSDVWSGSSASKVGETASVSQETESSAQDGLEHTTHKGAGIFSYIANLFHSVISFIANLPEILSGTQNVTTHPGKTVLNELKNNPQELNDLAAAIERNKGATERIEGAGLRALPGAIDKNPNAIAKLTLALANSSAEALKKPEGQEALKTFMSISGDALKQVIATPEGQKAMENIVSAGVENAVNSPETIQGIGRVIKVIFKSPVASDVLQKGSADEKLVVNLADGKFNLSVVPKKSADAGLTMGDYAATSILGKMLDKNNPKVGEFFRNKIQIKGVEVGGDDALGSIWQSITN